MKKFKCPCCGYLTLSELNHYEICDICDWEDDPIQSQDPNYMGGANVMSLIEAQAAFTHVKQPLPISS
jgi:hypothetical protein